MRVNEEGDSWAETEKRKIMAIWSEEEVQAHTTVSTAVPCATLPILCLFVTLRRVRTILAHCAELGRTVWRYTWCFNVLASYPLAELATFGLMGKVSCSGKEMHIVKYEEIGLHLLYQ